MAEAAPVLPCFKPADWEGADGCVCRRLSVGDVESSHLPYLAFGYDQPHTFEFLNKDQLPGLDKTAEEIESEAVRNVCRRKASWHATSARLGLFKKLKFLICGDDYFAAEKILDQDFMREAQKKLKAELLAVGIPRRGFLLATNGKQPLRLLGLFAGAVSAQYHRADSPPITPAVFAVVDGQIVGMLQGAEDRGRAAAEADEDGDEEDLDYYVSGLVGADPATGLESVYICAGGENVETLGPAIEDFFRQVIRKHLPRKEFDGEIRVIISNEMTPEPVRNLLPSLEAHLQGTARELKLQTKGGRPVTVTFEYRDR